MEEEDDDGTIGNVSGGAGVSAAGAGAVTSGVAVAGGCCAAAAGPVLGHNSLTPEAVPLSCLKGFCGVTAGRSGC